MIHQLQQLATSQLRDLSVLQGINNIVQQLVFDFEGIDCTNFTVNDLSFDAGEENGDTRNFDSNIDFSFDCEVPNVVVLNPEFSLRIPLEFTSSDFEQELPVVALRDDFNCVEDFQIEDITGLINNEEACNGSLQGELTGAIDLINGLTVEIAGPPANVNLDFDTDLAASNDLLEAEGFRVIDNDLLLEILVFFAEEIEGIDFIEDFLSVFQDNDSELEDIVEAFLQLLGEFGVDDDYFAEYLDYIDDLEEYLDQIDDLLPPGLEADDLIELLPPEIQEFIQLFPESLEVVGGLLFFVTPGLAESLAEDTFVDFFENFVVGTPEYYGDEIDSLRVIFGDASALDVATALVQFDLSGLIELFELNLTPEFLVLTVFQLDADLVELLYPNGIPEDFATQFAEIIAFLNDNLNGIIIEADQPLPEQQVNVLRFVALFDPLIAENIDRIIAGEVTGSEFFGFLQFENIVIAELGIVITPVRAEFISNIVTENVEDSVFELGVIQTPRVVVNEFTTSLTLEIFVGGELETVVVTNEVTAAFRVAAALVAGDDLTDIGLFGIENVGDFEVVSEDALNCATSQVGFSVLALEQSLTSSLATDFADDADNGIEGFLNSVGDLYAGFLPQLVSNLVSELVIGEITTFEENAEVAEAACAETSINQNLGGDDDNVVVLLGAVGAVVAIIALIAVIAIVVVVSKGSSKGQQSPVAETVPVKAGVVPDEGTQKVGVSF